MTSKPKRPYSVEHEAGYQAGLKNLPPAGDSENYRAGHAAGVKASAARAAKRTSAA